jgi:hypothetical protein
LHFCKPILYFRVEAHFTRSKITLASRHYPPSGSTVPLLVDSLPPPVSAVGSCGAKNEMLSPGSWARARATQQVLDGWHRRLLHASPSLSVSTFHTLLLLLIVRTASSGVVDWRCPWCNVGVMLCYLTWKIWAGRKMVRICVSWCVECVSYLPKSGWIQKKSEDAIWKKWCRRFFCVGVHTVLGQINSQPLLLRKALFLEFLSRLVIVLLSLSVSRGFERVVGKRRGRFNQRRGVKRVSGRGPDGRHFPAGGERADESTRISNWRQQLGMNLLEFVSLWARPSIHPCLSGIVKI